MRELRPQIERKAFERSEIASARAPGLLAVACREQVALLPMHKDGITVAEYWTELLTWLHHALMDLRERLAWRGVLLEGGVAHVKQSCH